MQGAARQGDRGADWAGLAFALDLVAVAHPSVGDRAVAAPAVAALEGDDVDPVPAHSGARREAQAHRAVGSGGDAAREALREDEHHGGNHWLMISSRTCAARGPGGWPRRKTAFFR